MGFSLVAFKGLVKTGLLEILREPRLFFFTMIFPLMFLAMFGVMSSIMPPAKSVGVSFFEFEFPGLLVFALMSVGLLGTSIPIIEMRQKGTLRLLQVTPLSASTFIAANIVVRLILSLGQILLFLILGVILHYVQGQNVLQLFLLAILGVVVMLTLGFLFGGFFRSVEIASGIISGLMAPILMVSGILLPLYIMPKVMKKVAEFIPFSYLGDAMRQIIFHKKEFFPVYIEIVILVGFIIICYLLTRWTFRWSNEKA